MNPRVLFSVLRELGVLFEAPGAGEIDEARGGPDSPAHVFHAHTPLWEYEEPCCAYPYSQPGLRPVYETLPPDLGLEGVLGRTRLLVFLGAADTPELRRCLDRPETFLLILEPDARRLARFAARVPAARLARRAVILLGGPEDFLPPMAQLLPPDLFGLGFPVFYGLPEFLATEQAARLVELVEILFYRHRMYHLTGQSNYQSLPMRPMARGLFFDQQLHFYANASECLRWPDIRPLKGAFQGETAVLAAAGPDLPARLDYLRDVRERAVIIAVNNALKPLLAGGVRPHFVVANDTSVHTARSWEGLPRLADVALVGHCLADLGGEVFGRKFLFGTYAPELYGHRPSLRLHGSVITTAFSLARHMGVARCVLAGAQLCSPDPWRLSYSRGSIHETEAGEARPLTGAWPQLVPVADMAGRRRYTTLNFLDAAHWLRDEIRTSSIPCATLSSETILHGPGIEHVPDCPVQATGRLGRRLGRAAAAPPPRLPRQPVLASLGRELSAWRAVEAGALAILEKPGGEFLGAAQGALEQFDQGGVSYLVQRFDGFDNRRFHALALEPGADGASREQGLRYYLEHVAGLARRFTQVLEGQLRLLA